MTLAQMRLYLDAAERERGRAFRLDLIAARSAWMKGDAFSGLIAKLPD